MAIPSKGPWRNRDSTYKKQGHWNIHIARSLAEDQPELESYLDYIRSNTEHFVRYKAVADLCLNVVLLDGVIHKIFGTKKFEKIPKQRINDFERELNGNLNDSPDKILPVADIYEPFGVYGPQKQFLGLRLDRKLPHISNEEESKAATPTDKPKSDAALITNYLAENYDIPKSFVKKNMAPLDAHINIGTLAIENLSPEEQEYMLKFPSDYILRSIKKDNELSNQVYGTEIEPIRFAPASITLNGLRAVSEARDSRRLAHF